jgi:hypothetical protein
MTRWWTGGRRNERTGRIILKDDDVASALSRRSFGTASGRRQRERTDPSTPHEWNVPPFGPIQTGLMDSSFMRDDRAIISAEE